MGKDIEQQLKDAARNSGLSIYALAKQTGVPYSAVHGFVKGNRRISLRNGARLARVLGLKLQPARRTKKGR